MDPEQLTEKIIHRAEKGQIQGLLCAIPTGKQQRSVCPQEWKQAGKGAIPVEANLFLLTCFFTMFVPCFLASFSTLHISGSVTPPQVAKRREVEVPIYPFGKIPLCFKSFV